MAESRPKRWGKACSEAQSAVDALREAFEELKSIQEEYQEWLDNLPENLQSSSLADKLQTVLGIDLESCADEAESVVTECDSADLPLGFGRD